MREIYTGGLRLNNNIEVMNLSTKPKSGCLCAPTWVEKASRSAASPPRRTENHHEEGDPRGPEQIFMGGSTGCEVCAFVPRLSSIEIVRGYKKTDIHGNVFY